MCVRPTAATATATLPPCRFASAHMLVFGQELEGYQNLRETSYSLLMSLVGDLQLFELERVNAWWGPLFVICFTLVRSD